MRDEYEIPIKGGDGTDGKEWCEISLRSVRSPTRAYRRGIHMDTSKWADWFWSVKAISPRPERRSMAARVEKAIRALQASFRAG